MGSWSSELKFAGRRLAATPVLSLAAVLTLGLAIGAVSALFGVVDGVVIRPLPHPEPERLVWLDHGGPGIGLDDGLGFTSGLYTHYRRRNPTLEEIGVFRHVEVTLTGDGEPERVGAARATPSLFRALRTVPHRGRLFTEDEGREGKVSTVVLSHELWSRRWGGDAGLVGSVLRVDGEPLEVVGILPPGFAPPEPGIELWLPLGIDPEAGFGGFNLQGLARLAPGATATDVRRDLDVRIAGLPEAFPDSDFAPHLVSEVRLAARVTPLKDHVVGEVARTLWLLLGAVMLVLLVACANVANLLLVRAEARRRDVALRAALGAGRGSLLGHFVSESLLLAIAGGAFGLALATVGVRLLVAWSPVRVPRLEGVGLDLHMVAGTAGLTLFVSLAAATLPLLRSAPPAVALRGEGRGLTPGGGLRSRQLLVAGQIALATVLLVGAGLLVRSFQELRRVDPGFRSDGVLTFELGLPDNDYPSRPDAAGFHDRLLERLRALPGVQGAGVATCLPLTDWCGGDPLTVEGDPPIPGEVPPVVSLKRATRGYFDALGIPVTAGDLPRVGDPRRPSREVVLNAEAARLYFPGEDPLGRRIYPGGVPQDREPEEIWYTVVGVVGNARVAGLTGEPEPVVYLPLVGVDDRGGRGPHEVRYALRATVPPLSLADAVRREVRALDPHLPLAHLQPMEALVRRATGREALASVLMTVAAGVALLLGTVGLFGVLSYTVGRRRGEIGLRMALGARAGQVRGMVLRQAGGVALGGLGAGLALALALGRWIETLLFGITPTDPLVYAVVTGVLLSVVLVSGDLPARRAARTDPAEVLRAD